MEFLDAKYLRYAEMHSAPESALLKKINRETNTSVLKPRMLSGHLQGRFLSMIGRMIRPASVLEIGTYTGYSALCFAEGLAAGGKVITIDNNEELEERVRNYFHEAQMDHKIEYHVGNALTLVPQMTGPFDLVFIDADKENYSNYFDLVIGKIPVGGYILADNVLWSGKVLDSKPDKDTRAIIDFNDKVHADVRVDVLLLPVRDGITIMRKISP